MSKLVNQLIRRYNSGDLNALDEFVELYLTNHQRRERTEYTNAGAKRGRTVLSVFYAKMRLTASRTSGTTRHYKMPAHNKVSWYRYSKSFRKLYHCRSDVNFRRVKRVLACLLYIEQVLSMPKSIAISISMLSEATHAVALIAPIRIARELASTMTSPDERFFVAALEEAINALMPIAIKECLTLIWNDAVKDELECLNLMIELTRLTEGTPLAITDKVFRDKLFQLKMANFGRLEAPKRHTSVFEMVTRTDIIDSTWYNSVR